MSVAAAAGDSAISFHSAPPSGRDVGGAMPETPSDPPGQHAPRPWGAAFALPCLVITYLGAKLAAHAEAAPARGCGRGGSRGRDRRLAVRPGRLRAARQASSGLPAVPAWGLLVSSG